MKLPLHAEIIKEKRMIVLLCNFEEAFLALAKENTCLSYQLRSHWDPKMFVLTMGLYIQPLFREIASL